MDNGNLPKHSGRQRAMLHELLQEKGLRPKEYALFFVTGEGKRLPISAPDDEIEKASGFVVDREGRVFSFWIGWDETAGRPALEKWEQVEPEPEWFNSDEFRKARRLVGLSAAWPQLQPKSRSLHKRAGHDRLAGSVSNHELIPNSE